MSSSNGNEMLVGTVSMRGAGTRSHIKRLRSRETQLAIQAHADDSSKNMFNTPSPTGGESFVSYPARNGEDIAKVVIGVMGVVGIGIAAGFYIKR